MAFDFGNEEKKNKLTDSLKKTLHWRFSSDSRCDRFGFHLL